MTVDLAALRALVEAAPPGPWWFCAYDEDDGYLCKCGKLWSDADNEEPLFEVTWPMRGDKEIAIARFIMAARTAVPALLDEVERLRALVETEADCAAKAIPAAVRWMKRAEAAEAEVERWRGNHAQYCATAAENDRLRAALRRVYDHINVDVEGLLSFHEEVAAVEACRAVRADIDAALGESDGRPLADDRPTTGEP